MLNFREISVETAFSMIIDDELDELFVMEDNGNLSNVGYVKFLFHELAEQRYFKRESQEQAAKILTMVTPKKPHGGDDDA